MAEEANQQAVVSPLSAEVASVRPDALESKGKGKAGANGTSNGVETRDPVDKGATKVEPVEPTDNDGTHDKSTARDGITHDQPATTQQDVNMEDQTTDERKLDNAAPAADESAEVDTPKKPQGRRKSDVVPEHKSKKLTKKASKAKMTHTDAKPGDYFFVKLKGYPLWPAIICDETMLPNTLLKSRPVTAVRPDGTYRADYEDGGAKVKDRTFAVMYLHTNEFGWIPNYDLVDLDFETVADLAPARKDLYAAHQLAAEKHDLDYFKEILKSFMDARQAEADEREAAKAAKKGTKAKRKSKVPADDEEGQDVELPDAPVQAEPGEEDVAGAEKPKSKKRKADEDASNPQRADSVKKPKTTIKLTTTPKAANGTGPKAAKDQSTPKSAKSKPKKSAAKVKETAEVAVPKEPELTPEQKRVRKEKEILFLRHKLQKGLLTRDQEPKEEEMRQMSEYVTNLEGYADLEVSIIRVTKINKVLKAILKLNTIPKEEEFQFKPRSQSLLDKWNKLLASEQGTPVAAPTATNGASDDAKTDVDDAKASPTEGTNGATESLVEEKVEESGPTTEALVAESEKTPILETPAAETTKELITEQSAVESTA